MAVPSVDDDSVDVTLYSKAEEERPRLDIQLKCTENADPVAGEFRYSLKRKNYDDLRAGRLIVPRILIVMVVPNDISNWIHQSEAEMSLRHSAYWVSLRDLPSTTNSGSITVRIPVSQRLTADALGKLIRERGASA